MSSFVSALIALAILAVPAAATAVSSVKQAFWQADFAWYDDGTGKTTTLPAGVLLTCTGTASAEGSAGCRDNASATVISNNGVWEMVTVDRTGGLSLRNIANAPLGGVFAFTARFGSFYPAAPDSGARVDDGGTESADYFTVVNGAGGFDLHGCNMASGPGHSGPHACRPTPPEYQESVFTLVPQGDWAELAADWQIYIQVSALGQGSDPVPETGTFYLMATMIGLFARRRRLAVDATERACDGAPPEPKARRR